MTFGNRDGKRSTNTTYADDSALRECDESRGTRYSERHSAHNDAGSARWLPMAARARS